MGSFMDDEPQFEKRQSIIGAVAGGGPVAPGKYRKLTVLLPQFNGTSSGALVLEDNVYGLPLTVIFVSNVSLVWNTIFPAAQLESLRYSIVHVSSLFFTTL